MRSGCFAPAFCPVALRVAGRNAPATVLVIWSISVAIERAEIYTVPSKELIAAVLARLAIEKQVATIKYNTHISLITSHDI